MILKITIDPDSTNKNFRVVTSTTDVNVDVNADVTKLIEAAYEAGKNGEEIQTTINEQ